MSLQLRTTVKPEGSIELSLATVPIPEPKPDQVLVRMEAAPINPSDLGLLFGPADMGSVQQLPGPTAAARIAPGLMGALRARVGKSLPAGNEGGGVVVRAGSSAAAQALVGKTVGIIGGAAYSQYRAVSTRACLEFPAGVTPAEAAAWYVNPMTVLGFLETMRRGGNGAVTGPPYKALVHTAAASNLGQMLVKVCLKDGIDLVNIVRKQEHVDLLKSLGAKYVVNSAAAGFRKELTAALAATGATVAFDATGGGKLASEILTCMEVAANMNAKEYSRYGSTVHKQVYIYGGLDRSPTTLNRAFGMEWGISGWLLTPLLQRVGPEAERRMRQRVAAEIKTTFSSKYTKEVSLAEAIDVGAINVYAKQATGQKYLINPNKGLAPKL